MDHKDLIIQVLQEVKNVSKKIESDQLANRNIFSNYNSDEVNQVIEQLIKDKYINAVVEGTYYDGSSSYTIFGITNSGINYLKNNYR